MIDSHAHLTTADLAGDLEQILVRAYEAGVEAIVNICTTVDEMERGLALAAAHPWIYNVASTTPHDVETRGEAEFAAFAKAARQKKLVAVGETGLDYYYEHAPRGLQQTFLKRYGALAQECGLPLVIHCREAFADLFSLLDQDNVLLHCFTGTLEEAREVIRRGWMLSLSGIVTFKKSAELREVAREVPLEQLLIETDTPYLAPGKWRGKRNEPAYLVETAHVIAQERGMSLEALSAATAANTRRFFNLK